MPIVHPQHRYHCENETDADGQLNANWCLRNVVSHIINKSVSELCRHVLLDWLDREAHKSNPKTQRNRRTEMDASVIPDVSRTREYYEIDPSSYSNVRASQNHVSTRPELNHASHRFDAPNDDSIVAMILSHDTSVQSLTYDSRARIILPHT